MKQSVVIVDYGLGNLLNVKRAILSIGGQAKISEDPETIRKSKKIILPGVGAFKAGMDGLRIHKMVNPLRNAVKHGTQLLGLCLGMQLLFEWSEEFGRHEGLSLVKGDVGLLKIPDKEKRVKIPQIGWNALLKPKHVTWEKTILEHVREGEMVYFVHSFVAHPENRSDCLAETEYGGETFCSVVIHGNVIGTQFHPEKSGEVGLKILRAFVNN